MDAAAAMLPLPAAESERDAADAAGDASSEDPALAPAPPRCDGELCADEVRGGRAASDGLGHGRTV